MNVRFSWYASNLLQDWIMRKKSFCPNLGKCINWVKDKLKRQDSKYQLTKDDVEDNQIANELQRSGVKKRSFN